MVLPLQIAAGLALLTGIATLVHFFNTVLFEPENMSLGLATQQFPDLWRGRVYLFLVVLSWVVFAFSGAHGLLYWLPGEISLSFSGFFALLSVWFLRYIEESAHILHNYRKNLKVNLELEKLIKRAIIPSQETIDNFLEMVNSAETIAEREAYAKLTDLASIFAERDRKLCDYAVSQALREATKKADLQEQAYNKAILQVAKQKLRFKLNEALYSVVQPLPVAKTIDSTIVVTEFMIEPSVAGQIWEALYDFGEKLRRLREGTNIETLLENVAGTKVIPGTSFKLEAKDNAHGGYSEVLSIHGDVKGELADGLVFDSSLEGLIAAFFFRAALPGQLAWWHGLYGRDQEFIFTQERALDILESARVSPESEGLAAVNVPVGLRFNRYEDGMLALRCLTYRPGKGFYDFAVTVTGGYASPLIETNLYQWGRGILY